MFNTLKTIAAELKRANDLKERDIKNKEMYGWYIRVNPNLNVGTAANPQPYNGPVNYTESATHKI